jgi:HEAT repeat protein
MRRSSKVATAVAMTCAIAGDSLAQETIASHVARVRGGEVRMQYTARPGTCGDGRDMITYGRAMFARSFQGFGRANDMRCEPGPVRVTVTMEDGVPVRVRTQVGGRWQPDTRTTDLGTVSAANAAAYFLSIVPQLEANGFADKGRLLLPAVLADSAPIITELLAIARHASRRTETRRQAIQWTGLLGDASVVPGLVALARSEDGDDGRGKKGGLGGSAAFALSFLPDNAGVPALIDLTRAPSAGTRRQAVFALAQTDDPRAKAVVKRVAEDTRESTDVRKHAVFSLAHGEYAESADFAWLRAFWARANDEQLKESIAHGISQDESREATRWFLDRVRDESEPLEVRRKVLFWAGQREETPTRDLFEVIRTSKEASLREHGAFVLSQRDDDAAMDALIELARSSDIQTRKKAIFWLGQSENPRAEQFIRALLTK